MVEICLPPQAAPAPGTALCGNAVAAHKEKCYPCRVRGNTSPLRGLGERNPTASIDHKREHEVGPWSILALCLHTRHRSPFGVELRQRVGKRQGRSCVCFRRNRDRLSSCPQTGQGSALFGLHGWSRASARNHPSSVRSDMSEPIVAPGRILDLHRKSPGALHDPASQRLVESGDLSQVELGAENHRFVRGVVPGIQHLKG